MRRKLLFVGLTAIFSGTLTIAVAEIFLRIVSPQASMHPRREFSLHYGFEHYRSQPVVHEAPGRWRFEYTVNEYRHRGDAVPISNRYTTRNIVVLGDSYSFGVGVNDGEEYPTVMKRHLGPGFEVINLGIGGWGLTQQIRKFYEFGVLYQPSLVVLQFSLNDPSDNLANRVTTVEDGRFVFHDSVSTANWVKKYLSESIIQKSQLYNLARDSAYRFFESRTIETAQVALEEAAHSPQQNEVASVPVADGFHVELLQTFADDLSRRGTPLVLISVNRHLRKFRAIHELVSRLDEQDKLRYVEVTDWFEGVTDYSSAEGHLWGMKAHDIIGSRLAEVVRGVAAPAEHGDREHPHHGEL